MSADNALGLFVLAMLVVSGGAYLVLARVWDMWPFRAGGSCPVCGDWVNAGEDPCEPTEVVAFDAWSGVDTHHGDDGNSGHG